MGNESFEETSFRALSEISEAVERGFSESGLVRMVSDDGRTNVLPGLKRYITLVVVSFTYGEGEEVHTRFEDKLATLGELDGTQHMPLLVINVHAGDWALVKGLVKSGSVANLAAEASAAYGMAAGILRRLGQNSTTFGYMSVRAQPLVESMNAIGVELDLIPRARESNVLNATEFHKYGGSHFSRS